VLAVSATFAVQVCDLLRAAGVACEQKLHGSTSETAAQAISAICRGEADGVIILTAEPELGACLANRNDRIRAAVAGDANGVERVKSSLKPNVWAIDAQRTSFEMKKLVNLIVKS
jgi:ribose 5-phosphate isomerase RpiB